MPSIIINILYEFYKISFNYIHIIILRLIIFYLMQIGNIETIKFLADIFVLIILKIYFDGLHNINSYIIFM